MELIYIILLLTLLNYLNAQLINCLNNCVFGGQYKIGPFVRTLSNSQLCYNNKLFDFTISGLQECTGTPVPITNPHYCPVDGEQECAPNCNCRGSYTICFDHVKIRKINGNFVCIQNNTVDFKEIAFHPRCSDTALTNCGSQLLCRCTECTNGDFFFENKNYCGQGYYLCVNEQWNFYAQNETTVCTEENEAVVCRNEPYCQVSPYNCYNTIDDELRCNLPINGTCVKSCAVGKGFWNCVNGVCTEKLQDNVDPNEYACHDTPNGPEWIDLNYYNNICKCPGTDCTTTPGSTTTPESSTESTTTEVTTTPESSTESTTTDVTTTQTTTQSTTISISCPTQPPHDDCDHDHKDDCHDHKDDCHDHKDDCHDHKDECHNHKDDCHDHKDDCHDHKDDCHDHKDDCDKDCEEECDDHHHCEKKCHCKDKCHHKPHYSLCPLKYGRFCLQPFRRGNGYLYCKDGKPEHIRIEYNQVCKQTDRTHVEILPYP